MTGWSCGFRGFSYRQSLKTSAKNPFFPPQEKSFFSNFGMIIGEVSGVLVSMPTLVIASLKDSKNCFSQSAVAVLVSQAWTVLSNTVPLGHFCSLFWPDSSQIQKDRQSSSTFAYRPAGIPKQVNLARKDRPLSSKRVFHVDACNIGEKSPSSASKRSNSWTNPVNCSVFMLHLLLIYSTLRSYRELIVGFRACNALRFRALVQLGAEQEPASALVRLHLAIRVTAVKEATVTLQIGEVSGSARAVKDARLILRQEFLQISLKMSTNNTKKKESSRPWWALNYFTLKQQLTLLLSLVVVFRARNRMVIDITYKS